MGEATAQNTKPKAFKAESFVLSTAQNVFCGYGGTGRRAGFRFQWETVEVQILLAAPIPTKANQSFYDDLFFYFLIFDIL